MISDDASYDREDSERVTEQNGNAFSESFSDLVIGTPFGYAVSVYRELGWLGTLPVVGKSERLPNGYTGYKGRFPDDVQINEWSEKRACDNIALRLPANIIGIDIDAYGGKNGLQTIQGMETLHGRLPPSWYSTSRDDGSRIVFYRLPADVDPGETQRKLVSDFGFRSNVEIIRSSHRYAVVWPSVHPGNDPRDPAKGKAYRWYTSDDALSDVPPRPEEFAVIPTAWLENVLLKKVTNGSDDLVDVVEVDIGQTDDYQSSGVDSHLMLVVGAPSGEQNNRMFGYLCSLRARRMSREEAIGLGMMAVQRMRNSRPEDPWTIEHVVNMVSRIWREYPAGTSKERVSSVTADSDESCNSWLDGFRKKAKISETGSDTSTSDESSKEVETSEESEASAQESSQEIRTPSLRNDCKPGEEPTTDTGNAWRFLRLFGKEVRYIPELDEWHYWDGLRWRADHTGRVLYLTQLVAEDIRKCAERADSDGEGENRDKWAAWQHATESKLRRAAMLDLAAVEPEAVVPAKLIDADPALLGCADGVVELRDETWKFRPMSPKDRILYNTDVRLDQGSSDAQEDADWDALISYILPDPEIRRYVQALEGYGLYGSNFRRLWVTYHGPPSTGKSTISELIGASLGDHARVANMSIFRGNSDERPRADIVHALAGRRLALSEAGAHIRLHADQIKAATGGDTLTARVPFAKRPIEKVPMFTPFMVTNEMPEIEGADQALRKRMVVVPFAHVIDDDPGMMRLVQKLRAAPPRRAILRWMLEGWTMAQTGVLDDVPEIIRKVTAAAKLHPFDEFLAEWCVLGEGLWDTVERIACAYQAWMKGAGVQGGRRAISTAVGRLMSQRGYVKSKRTVGVVPGPRWGRRVESSPGSGLVTERSYVYSGLRVIDSPAILERMDTVSFFG